MNIRKFLTKNKHSVPKLFLVIGLFLTLFVPEVSFATGPIATVAENAVLGFLWKYVNAVFGTLLWMSGALLDYTITHFVVGFGYTYTAQGIGFAIDTLWSKIRDFFNLIFIFGLVYIGFRMILNSSDSSAKKALGTLIIAALLINFSLFITKTVIDFSNIAAKQFVEQYEIPNDPNKYSISNTLMKSLGVQTIFNTQFDGKVHNFSYIFGTMFVYVISAFVFMAGGILLLIRFISLNFYMLLSPVMFIGMIFPGFDSVSKKYWKGFLGQAFFAPAYFLMIYFSMEIIKILSVPITGNRKNLAGVFQGADATQTFRDFEGSFIFFIVACGFMIASLVVAKSMGAVGAEKAVALGNSTARKVRGSVTSAIGRHTVGRAAGLMDTANKYLDRSSGGRLPSVGRLSKRFLSVASLGTLDERGRRAVISAGKNNKFGGSYSRQDDNDWESKRKQEVYGLNQQKENEKIIKTGTDGSRRLKEIRTKQKNGVALSTGDSGALPILEQAEAKMIAIIASMANSQLDNLSAADLEKFAPHFTSSQIANIMKSDKINPEARGGMMKARQDAIKNMIKGSTGVLTKELTKLSDEQIETLGADWIQENVHLLSNTQMDNVKKSKNYVESQKNSFVAQRNGWHRAAVTTGGPASFNGRATDPSVLFNHSHGGGRRKAEDVANLGRDVLVDRMTPAYIQANPTFLTKDVLEVISDKKTLSATDRTQLKDNIEDAYAASSGAVSLALAPLIDYLGSPPVARRGF